MSGVWSHGGRTMSNPKQDANCDNDARMDQHRKVLKNSGMQRSSNKTLLSAKERRKQKRFRSAFTTTQVALMEQEFRKNPYVTSVQREQMANKLHLPERAIKIWFQNRRMKEKRDPPKTIEHEAIPKIDLPTFKYENDIKSESRSGQIQFNVDDSNENEIDIHIDDNVDGNQNYHPRAKLVLSNGNLTISKIAKLKSSAVSKSTLSHSYGGTVRESDTKPINIVNQMTTVERSILQKQPVGLILPFSQVIGSEPQKSPENLTMKQNKVVEQCNKYQATPQHPGYLPLDLSKYYTPVPPMNAWNRLNFIPLIQGAPQGIQYNSTTTIPPETQSSYTTPVKKCCCNCHSSHDGKETPRLQPPYPIVYTQYIPHIMAQLPPQYTNNKY